MKITIIGSGNVAEALIEAVCNTPHTVRLWARNHARGGELSSRFGIPYTPIEMVSEPADLYIMAVSDRAIGSLSDTLAFPQEAVVAHTAGGVGIDALSGKIVHRAVFYPLQTFSGRRIHRFSDIPVFTEASTSHAAAILASFAGTLSVRTYPADSETRMRLHTAAVFACNFTNHLFSIAADLLRRKGIPFEALRPLVSETVDKAFESSYPEKGQTGPAVRNDEDTMERHRRLLHREGPERYEELYMKLSESIWETSKKTSQK